MKWSHHVDPIGGNAHLGSKVHTPSADFSPLPTHPLLSLTSLFPAPPRAALSADAMGKYMKKSKPTTEVSSLDLPLGVRTRARTLAMQRSAADGGSYLQLRSRRLEKPPVPKPKQPPCKGIAVLAPSRSLSSRSGSVCCVRKEIDAAVVEVSFGDNVVDVEEWGRKTRETTPCSLIRNPETIGTPGSTNRPTISTTATRRTQSSTRRDIPTAQDMEEFFSEAEQRQQRSFVEKYNFDPVNGLPLPGRFKWVKLNG